MNVWESVMSVWFFGKGDNKIKRNKVLPLSFKMHRYDMLSFQEVFISPPDLSPAF